MLRRFSLKNGVQVATYRLPNLKSIHIRISVKGGSLVEDKRHNGVAHFMEHMLVQGIPSYPNVEEFSRFIEGLAGSYGAYTKSLNVSFYITVPAPYVEDAVKITAETFFEPLFVETALEKERRAVLEEIHQRMDAHWYKITDFFLDAIFSEKHPLTYDGGGSIEAVTGLTRKDLIAYWKKYFVPKNTFLLVSGNFEEKELRRLLDRYAGTHESQGVFEGFPKMGNADFNERSVSMRHDRTLKTCYLELAFPAVELGAAIDIRMRQNLALVILGQLRNSRLFKLLRHQRGLVYDVGAGGGQYPGLGYITISSQVSPERLEEVVHLIAVEVASFVSNGPTEDELSFAKNYLTNQWLMAFDHPSSITGWVEDHLLWDNNIHLPEDYARMLETIKREDIIAVMQKFWDFSKLHLVIQGPILATGSNKKKFASLLSDL